MCFYPWRSLVRKGTSPSQLHFVNLIMVLVLAATFVTPHGVRLYAYLFRELTAEHTGISEWQGLKGIQVVHFILLMLIPSMLMWLARLRGHKNHMILLALASVGTVRHGRLFVLAVIFAALVSVRSFALIADDLKNKISVFSKRGFVWSLFGVVLLLILATSTKEGVRNFQQSGFHVTVDPKLYPIQAVEFLKIEKLGPNVIHPLHWGGYLIWHLHPQYRVAVDGRNIMVYPSEDVDAYVTAYEQGDLETLLQGKTVNVALVEQESEMDRALLRSHHWVELYRDSVAVIFIPIDKQIEKESLRDIPSLQEHDLVFP